MLLYTVIYRSHFNVILLSLPMQMGGTFNWKSARGYIVILAILIVLILLTVYVSQLQIQRISQEIPLIGGVISFLPPLLPVFKLIPSKKILS